MIYNTALNVPDAGEVSDKLSDLSIRKNESKIWFFD